MIDLTPLDVRKKRGDFRRGLRGYDPEEVDTFMDLVADRFEELVRENLSLSEKAESLEAQLQALASRESAVQEALVTAQKLREDVQDQSLRDAERLREEAIREAGLQKAEAESEIARRLGEVETEIARRLGEAEGLIRERQHALEDLERSRQKFLKSFRGLLERELDGVEVEEARRPLEDTPLDLTFMTRAPAGSEEAAEADRGAEEPAQDVSAALEEGTDGREEEAVVDEEAVVEEEPAPEEEAAVAEDTPGGFDSQILKVAEVEEGAAEVTEDAKKVEEVAQGWVGEEPSPEWKAGLVVAGGVDPSMDEPTDGAGPTAEEALDVADPPAGEPLDVADPPAGEPLDVADLAPDESLPREGREPKWLFSLLKREEDEEGEEK
jgi:DivIVA domain-containing protein